MIIINTHDETSKDIGTYYIKQKFKKIKQNLVYTYLHNFENISFDNREISSEI